MVLPRHQSEVPVTAAVGAERNVNTGCDRQNKVAWHGAILEDGPLPRKTGYCHSCFLWIRSGRVELPVSCSSRGSLIMKTHLQTVLWGLTICLIVCAFQWATTPPAMAQAMGGQE